MGSRSVVRSVRWPGPARVVAGLVVLAAVVVAAAATARHPALMLPAFIPSPDMRDVHADFDTFWHSAVALLQGRDVYDTPAKLTNLNPPVLSVLMVPLAGLEALTAYRVFVVVSLVAVLGVVGLVARALRLPGPVTALVLAVVALSSPLHGTLMLGQIYPLLLVGLALGWWAERTGRPRTAALLYGITVALKPSLAPVLLLAAAQRRWRSFVVGVASAAVATGVGVVAAGPAAGLQWLAIALDEAVPVTPDNASLPGLALRLGLSSSVGTILGGAVLLGTLLHVARLRDRVDPAGTAVFAVLAAGLLVSPISWHNYLMLLWPGVLLLVAGGRGAVAAALLAVTLIPVSWTALWPGQSLGAAPTTLYTAVLFAHWLALLLAVRDRDTGRGWDPATADPATADPRTAGPETSGRPGATAPRRPPAADDTRSAP